MKKIQGDKVFLRLLSREDAIFIFDSTEIEEIRFMTGTTKRFKLEEVEAHIQKSVADPTRVDFAVCLSETNEVIGDLAILEIDEENRKAFYRISMHNLNIVGKGYGSEATQLALSYAFDVLQLNRVQLEVYSHNPRGIRAYEKVGFIQEGRLRESIFINNQFSDEIIMSVLKRDYEKQKR
ncbi:GNAT family N-acetyltransferase [Bacillus cereus]|uniref:GNAT family N-acetyltransferase n=1 Tax=Bacillus proteolyticus TaxID=2026192 RepID=A0ABV3IFZ5_9BACI|nr:MULTISPECIES: GNAT family protein [Bacillus]PEE18456.1 GNAT family N-acetyltransferase [Bacillus cereus]MBJ8107664.1 GNAT family N-acetyltransferase [Bacillus cereus group sp. N8]MED0906659.1 GNAT family protein [Bacillus nitratireducens]PES81750.1 GNAT family N-acetyltransferase [Bacillus cereus]PET02749.1 GNAT family N-acetyltransferase [Bacillus cereus]